MHDEGEHNKHSGLSCDFVQPIQLPFGQHEAKVVGATPPERSASRCESQEIRLRAGPFGGTGQLCLVRILQPRHGRMCSSAIHFGPGRGVSGFFRPVIEDPEPDILPERKTEFVLGALAQLHFRHGSENDCCGNYSMGFAAWPVMKNGYGIAAP